MTLAFPMMLVARFSKRDRKRSLTLREQLGAEYQLSPPLNTALLALCDLEHLLRKAGLWLPFGGSQVLVAQRPVS